MRALHGKVFPIKWHHERAQNFSTKELHFWAPSWCHLMGKTSFPWSVCIGPKPGNSRPCYFSNVDNRQVFIVENCQFSKPTISEHESPPITTELGLSPSNRTYVESFDDGPDGLILFQQLVHCVRQRLVLVVHLLRRHLCKWKSNNKLYSFVKYLNMIIRLKLDSLPLWV